MIEVKRNNQYMRELIDAFPDNLTEAIEIVNQSPLKKSYSAFSNVVICGMGGSGIGGKLVSSWIADEINIPINFCQDYTLPSYVNDKTLIIASSNSGNTEETLSATLDAHNRGAAIVAVCSGGKLHSFCKKWDYDCIVVPGGKPPRTTLAFSIVQLTRIFGELNLIKKEKLTEFSLAKELILSNKNGIHAEAKQVADFINGKELIIYSESKDEAVAIRARQQFNENSKILCNTHVIPEMNHNELVGWYGGVDRYAVLFLDTNDWHPKNKKRLAFSIETIESKTNYIMSLYAKGDTMLVRSLYLINIIDWASLYLAELNNVDSVYIGVIDNLKSSLKN
ncbi:MAG: bifunctional phosphoglucose/phosphomannose isomerase [Crocinitomicaceae bacterium]